MKQLLVLALVALSLAAQGQSPPASNEPYWRTFAIEEDGSIHQVDLRSITRPNGKGEFSFNNRVIFRQPVIIEGGGVDEPIIGTMMQASGNCLSRQTVIKHDFMVTLDQRRVGIDLVAKSDSLSEPGEGSVHGMLLNLVCGKKVSV
jgi:hypothetical protein